MTNPVNKKVDREKVEAIFAADPKRSNTSIGLDFGVSRECIRGYRTSYERRLRNARISKPLCCEGTRDYPKI